MRTAYRRAARPPVSNGMAGCMTPMILQRPRQSGTFGGTACLYGLAFAVITALGCAPGLGFVRQAQGSFVYDIADLYKAGGHPLAFEVAQAPQDSPSLCAAVRDAMVEHHILERMVHDIPLAAPERRGAGGGTEAVYLGQQRSAPLPTA